LLAGCAKPAIVVEEFEPEQIIHSSRIQNVDNVSDYVVYLDAGDRIPLKVNLDSSVVHVADHEIDLVLKRRIYFRLTLPDGVDTGDLEEMTEEERQKILRGLRVYLSPDAERWAPYTDLRAVKDVLGIAGGSVSFGMGISKEDGIGMVLTAAATDAGT
jgi:hypothetical protein